METSTPHHFLREMSHFLSESCWYETSTQHWFNVGTESRRRRWTNLKLTVVPRLESTGMALDFWRSLFAPTQHDRDADDIDDSVLEYAIFSTLWTLFTALTSPLTLCDWGIDAVSLQCEAVFLQKKRSKNQGQCSVLFRDPILGSNSFYQLFIPHYSLWFSFI